MSISSDYFIEYLRQIIDLPSDCKSITLHLKLNEKVVVECEYYPNGHEVDTVIKRFELVEKRGNSYVKD